MSLVVGGIVRGLVCKMLYVGDKPRYSYKGLSVYLYKDVFAKRIGFVLLLFFHITIIIIVAWTVAYL